MIKLLPNRAHDNGETLMSIESKVKAKIRIGIVRLFLEGSEGHALCQFWWTETSTDFSLLA